jgi:hypothetical protein
MSDTSSATAHRSFWTTLPGILTGIAALLTAATGLLALWIQRGSSGVAEGGAAPPAAESATASAAGAGGSGETSPSDGPIHALGAACLNETFEGVPSGRVKGVDVGSGEVLVLSATETKEGAFGLELRDESAPVGGMRLSFDAGADRYTLERLVDGSCRPVSDMRNEDVPGRDPRDFPSWNALSLRLGERYYIISFGYSNGEVWVNRFQRFVR